MKNLLLFALLYSAASFANPPIRIIQVTPENMAELGFSVRVQKDSSSAVIIEATGPSVYLEICYPAKSGSALFDEKVFRSDYDQPQYK